MKEFKGTKGPWSVAYKWKYGNDTLHPIISQTDFVCQIVEDGTPVEEIKTNAKLIAAAPELLEALKNAYMH